MDPRRNWRHAVVKLYVEGGGDTNLLRTACRRGFSTFLAKAGLRGHMPRIVACGSRRDAYRAFCIALEDGEDAMLLIDSESPVAPAHQTGKSNGWRPWDHLAQRQDDQWQRPVNAADAQCHLMVECMEAWMLADQPVLKTYFGRNFRVTALPAQTHSIETIPKRQTHKSLADSTKDCWPKGPYAKGSHSFAILALIRTLKAETP